MRKTCGKCFYGGKVKYLYARGKFKPEDEGKVYCSLHNTIHKPNKQQVKCEDYLFDEGKEDEL